MLIQMACNLDSRLLVTFVGHCNFGIIYYALLYVFIISPNDLNKLRKGIKRIYLEMDTKFSDVHWLCVKCW
jgi:hypothetical protein